MIKRRQYINAWVNIVAITMFFVTFFTAYFVAQADIVGAFVKSVFSLIIATIIARILAFFWYHALSPDDWRLVVKGPPEVRRRSELLMKNPEPSTET